MQQQRTRLVLAARPSQSLSINWDQQFVLFRSLVHRQRQLVVILQSRRNRARRNLALQKLSAVNESLSGMSRASRFQRKRAGS
jgi:hypothetical protein